METDTLETTAGKVSKAAAKAVKKSAKKASPTNETPHEKFQRLAPARMEAALKKVSLVGNLAGSGYHFEPSEAKDITDALHDAVEEVVLKFNKKSGRKGFAFRKRG